MVKKQMTKACNFYVSQWHLFAALLPYIRDELKNNNQIIFISQDNLEKGLNQLVSKLNLKFENKNGINDVIWLDENFKLDIKVEKRPIDIIVQGTVNFIKDINSYIDNNFKKIYREITVINCYEIYDTNEMLYNILDEHDYVFNTAGMNEKSAIFHGYINKNETFGDKYNELQQKNSYENCF